MEFRMKSKRTNAVTGIILFASISLFPVAVLFAGTGSGPTQNLEKTQLEVSIKKWQGMQTNLNKVLNKADLLNNYKVIK